MKKARKRYNKPLIVIIKNQNQIIKNMSEENLPGGILKGKDIELAEEMIKESLENYDGSTQSAYDDIRHSAMETLKNY